MRCEKCGAERIPGKKFCAECGAPLSNRCPKCGSDYAPAAKFCADCGAVLATPPGAATKPSDDPQIRATDGPSETTEGERKIVTALFADVKGSMELIEDLDPEEARAIVEPALKLMMEAVHHYSGYVAQSTGDGIFALFGAPIAYEDHPQRALLAALRMQAEVRRYAERLRAEKGVNLQVRVGANTGEVVVREIRTGERHSEYVPIGHSTSLAARLQALAAPGSIAIGEPLRKLVEGYFVFKSMGPARIKGVSEPLEIYEVTGLGPLRTRLQRAVGRGLTKFVGRKREMEALGHSAELARQGHGQIVAVVAEPGVGKSRLFFEFKATSQSGWLVLEAPWFPHGKATAYQPLIDLLLGYLEIADEDDARRRRQKSLGKLLDLDRSLEDALPYLFALLGIVEGEDSLTQMDAQIRRRRTQEAVKRILLRESLNQPLMLIFEDLHWIEEETQAFLNVLAEGIANAPILLLVNYRPEYSHTWGSKTYYTQLRLDPLAQKSAGEMVNALVGGDSPELAALKGLVLERTEGNPLFMEELIGSLFEQGVLVRNGTIKVTTPLNQLKIPPTVQGILAARIDRLLPEAKALLQTLAVIGMEFPLSLVCKVVQEPPDQVDDLLCDLQTGEFIYEQPRAGEVEYRFKHALTHQAAYDALLTERRKLLHERTARAIETLYHGRLEDHYIDLAHHYRSSNNVAKAVEYLRLAGEQAVERGAYAQALANVEPALKIIERLPEGVERLRAELGVRLMEGMTVTALHGLDSTERLHTFERVCELSEPLGDAPALFLALLNMGFALHHRFEARRALDIARRCVKLAEEDQNHEMLPAAYSVLALASYRSGDLLRAASVGHDAMKGFTSAHQRAAVLVSVNLWTITPVNLALAEQLLGKPDEALKLGNETVRRARELKQSLSVTSALLTLGVLRYERREAEAVRDLIAAEVALAEEHGFRGFLASGRALRAWATSELGQPEHAVIELETVASSATSFLQISKSRVLAQVYLCAGRAEEALALIGEELVRTEQSGAHLEAAELYRLKGEAVLARDSKATGEAEACFRNAIGIAQQQSAKWWELRTTVSLARLLRDTDRRDEARAMLADIYNWFTEGFDTADLKDAKALLDELRN